MARPRGRPRNMENVFTPPKSNVQFSEGQKSKGILDDYAVRKNLDTQEGTIQSTPLSGKDLVNKEYVDAEIAIISGVGLPKLNEVGNPDASKTFNFGNNKFLDFTSVDRTPIAGEGTFNFTTSGNFTGDLVHIHQHTGNAGAGTILLHLEAEDSDICPLKISGECITSIEANANIETTGDIKGQSISGVNIYASAHISGLNFIANENQTFIGSEAGSGNTGDEPTLIGYRSGVDCSGDELTAVGAWAGDTSIGDSNTFIGYNAGWENTGNIVTALGRSAGDSNEGNTGIFVGYAAGSANKGNDVVAIGYEAGKANTLSGVFIVKQANISATPLIHGDFETGIISGQHLRVAADETTMSGSYVANIVFGTGATPPTASGFTQGTIYVQYTP